LILEIDKKIIIISISN